MPQKPVWFDNKIGVGNIISWLTVFASLVYMIAFVRADINTLNDFRSETRNEIKQFREQRAADREAIVEMRQDVRYIRQVLEQQARGATPR